MTTSNDRAAPELASTVKQQADRVASLESTLFQVEIIVERANAEGVLPGRL